MSHGLRVFLLLLLLLVPASAARAQRATVKGPDYSTQGGPFSVLSGLNFHDIQRIEYVGEDKATTSGVTLEAEKFLVETWVKVPRFEFNLNYDTTDKPYPASESKLAEIEVWVARDADDRIHDEMLSGVHQFWRTTRPGFFARRNKVEASEQITYKDGKYLLFRILDQPVRHHQNPIFARRVVWADGKVVWFRFKRFVHDDDNKPTPTVPYNPDAAVDDFVWSHFTVRSGGVKLHAHPMNGSFRKEFFKLYEQGVFRGVV